MFVRRLLDERRPRIVVTGSSARLLSREIATSLRGRSLTSELFPFSFREYLAWKGIDLPRNGAYSSRRRAELSAAAGEYLEGGGFPEALAAPANLRREILQGYLDVVILRDVVERHRVSNVTALRALIRQVLHDTGGRFSVNRFAGQLRTMGITAAKNAPYAFLDHLSHAYLLFPVEIHSRSVRRRQVNPRKIYAVDTGLLRAAGVPAPGDRGVLLENLVFLGLRRRGLAPDYYLTASGREVDFIYRDESGAERLLQACWSLENPATRERELNALTEAMGEKRLSRAAVVTWLEEGEHGPVRVVPAWKWLLEG